MAKSRFTQDQIRAIVREVEAGGSLKDISHKYGVSRTTMYRWTLKVGDNKTIDKDRLRLLEIENRRLKSKFAELVLDYTSLRAALVKEVGRES